jgi:hypothetical protein
MPTPPSIGRNSESTETCLIISKVISARRAAVLPWKVEVSTVLGTVMMNETWDQKSEARGEEGGRKCRKKKFHYLTYP